MTRAQEIHAEIASMIEVKYATENGAYKAGTNINPTGAVNHSIGCAQPSADVMYNAMNKTTAGWGVTAILGDFHKGAGRIILALPMAKGKSRRNWGVGSGSKGSYNNSRVQWEVCEPSGHTYAGGTMIGYDVAANAEYFARMWALLVKWNVYVAVELGLTAADICDHAESYKAGMGSNHGDLGHWLPKHGKSMNDLRAEVAAILEDTQAADADAVAVNYRGEVTAGSGLRCRTAPVSGSILFLYSYGEVVTITKELDGWGYTGSGWVSLEYIRKITEEPPAAPGEEVIKLEMTKDELKALIRETVKEVMDEENPVYNDLKDVPSYWQGAAKALLDSEAVNGGTPASENATDLNLRKETLKAAVIATLYHEAKSKAGE